MGRNTHTQQRKQSLCLYFMLFIYVLLPDFRSAPQQLQSYDTYRWLLPLAWWIAGGVSQTGWRFEHHSLRRYPWESSQDEDGRSSFLSWGRLSPRAKGGSSLSVKRNGEIWSKLKDEGLKRRSNLCWVVEYLITFCRNVAFYRLQIQAEGKNPQSGFFGG